MLLHSKSQLSFEPVFKLGQKQGPRIPSHFLQTHQHFQSNALGPQGGITAVFLQLFTSRRERQEESHFPSEAGGVAPHLCRSRDSQSSSDRTRPHAMLWTEHGSKFAIIQFYWYQIILDSSMHFEPLYSLDPCTIVHCLFISQCLHMTFPNTQCPEALQKHRICFLRICTMPFLVFTPLFK